MELAVVEQDPAGVEAEEVVQGAEEVVLDQEEDLDLHKVHPE